MLQRPLAAVPASSGPAPSGTPAQGSDGEFSRGQPAPLILSDRHRTLALHVVQVRPSEYSWQLVLEEHHGSADCDCIIETQCCWPTHAQALSAGWAEGNRLLHGTRVFGDH